MPAARQPVQKRPRLPFKPPRPRVSADAGPSTTSKKTNGKKTVTTTSTTRKPTAGPSSRGARKSTSSRPRPPSPAPDSLASNSAASQVSASDSESGSPADRTRINSPSLSEEPDYILAEITTTDRADDDVTSSEPTIPPKLLTRLLHHHFRNEKVKIAKDANEVVAKYVDIFVREALARAAYERAESQGGAGFGDGFLEVEDLEKMAPQLVLDF